MRFSDYIVYVDESGDHNLDTPDPTYPVFVLAFCIFRKEDYVSTIVPAIQQLKFAYFGHDMTILHEREIRKATGDFRILQRRETRSSFMNALTRIMEEAPFKLIAVVIDKAKLKSRYASPDNPYSLAMQYGLERVVKCVASCQTSIDLGESAQRRGAAADVIHCVFERRGAKEDGELELAFRRVCDGANYSRERFPLSLRFAPKSCNSVGLQFADLCARPIGRHVLKPEQPNRAFEVLKKKLDSRGRSIKGYGLKLFPT